MADATGRYIAFLDSDDVWLPTKLQDQISFMESHGHVFTYSAYEKIDEAGVSLGLVGVPESVDYDTLLKTCYIGCLTAIYDAEFFGKQFMPLIRRRQDYALWLKLLKMCKVAYGLNVPLARYRVRSSSISSNKRKAAADTLKMFREVEGLSALKAFYYFSHYAVRGFMRNKTPLVAKWFGVLHEAGTTARVGKK